MIRVMKIIHFSQYYTPESTAGAFGAADNTRTWANLGADVTVFTGYPNHPRGKIYEGYTPKLMSIENIDGVKVVRSKLIVKESTSYVNKFINTLSFFLFGIINFCVNSKKIGGGFDVVTAADGPIFASLLGYVYAKIHKTPFIFEVRDLTWLQLIALGKKETAKSVQIMKRLELFLARKSDRIISITQGFKDVLISEGIENRKISVITNGVDTKDLIRRIYNNNSELFLMGYYGVLGLTQNIAETLPYADVIKKYCESFQYLIIGEGAHKEKIARTIAERKDKGIMQLPGMNPRELERYFMKTTIGVAALEKSDKFSYTIPSKVFQIMGRGIAILFIGPDGEAAQIIRENHAGLALTGSKEEDMQELDVFFSQGDWYGKLAQMGENGYLAVKNKYSRTKLAEKYYNVLCTIGRK